VTRPSKILDQDLTGTATLTSMEHWITAGVRCERSGNLTCTGSIADNQLG